MVCSTLKARPLQQSDSWDSFWVYEREGDILVLEGMQEKSVNIVLKKKREKPMQEQGHTAFESQPAFVYVAWFWIRTYLSRAP